MQYGRNYNWKVEAISGNCISTSVTQDFSTKEYPDIIVQSINTPATSFSGQSVLVGWETKNIGNGSSGSNIWYDAVYLSTDPVFDVTDSYLGARPNIAALMPNESYSNDITFTIPQGVQGNYYIIIRSDVYNSIIEADNGNNTSAEIIPITLTPPPDFQVESIIVPNNAFSEQEINVTWKVKNNGTGPTINTIWYDRIYLSDNPTFNINTSTSLKTIFHENGSQLDADSSYTKTTTVTLPQGIFGDYYIYVETDLTNYIYEYAFESNNVGTSSVMNVFLTPPPDLVVSSINTVDSLNFNQPFIISWIDENQGANPAIGSWNDRVYISDLDTFNYSQVTFLGNQNFSDTLLAGENISRQILADMPNIDADTVYIYVITDNLNSVYEFNQEDNNTLRSHPIKINKPDLEITAANIPITIYSGEDVTINYTISNNGVGDIFNLNNNDLIFYSDIFPFNVNTSTLLGSNNYSLNLSAQQNITKQKTLSIPNGVSGNKYFYIISDYYTLSLIHI